MIEVLKIEDFVISHMFRPYQSSFIDFPYESVEYKTMAKSIEQKLRRKPEYIIPMLENNPETKERIFQRIRKFGGVKFYRYLDMNTQIIRYIRKEIGGEYNGEIN